MARYIDVDKLIETLREIQGTYSPSLTKATNEAIDLGLSLAMRLVRKEPTADVVEVKRGYWYEIDSDVGWELVGCSVCGKEYSLCDGEDRTDYCPYCGAKMDGERKEAE